MASPRAPARGRSSSTWATTRSVACAMARSRCAQQKACRGARRARPRGDRCRRRCDTSRLARAIRHRNLLDHRQHGEVVRVGEEEPAQRVRHRVQLARRVVTAKPLAQRDGRHLADRRRRRCCRERPCSGGRAVGGIRQRVPRPRPADVVLPVVSAKAMREAAAQHADELEAELAHEITDRLLVRIDELAAELAVLVRARNGPSRLARRRDPARRRS